MAKAEERATAQAAAARREEARPEPDADWLRGQRNALVHAGDDEVPDEAALEAMAQGAVRIAFKTLFAAGWR